MTTQPPRYTQHALASGCIVVMDHERRTIVCEVRDERDAQQIIEQFEHHMGVVRALAKEAVELKAQVFQLTDELARVRATAEAAA